MVFLTRPIGRNQGVLRSSSGTYKDDSEEGSASCLPARAPILLSCTTALSGGFERKVLIKAEFLFDDVEELEREIDRIDDYFNHE